MTALDPQRIEEKLDKTVAGATEIRMELGGVKFQTMMELMEFAKLMAIAGAAVPYHLRGNPGACLAICTRALRFGFDPFSLAEHSYSMKKSTKTEGGQWEDVETIAYDSFVIHAIIEAHAPLTGRLRITYAGEGDDRRCTVTGIPEGEKEPLILESPRLGDLKTARGTNDKGQIKGSPLWLTNPDQQLAYHTRRDFCRRYFPETLLGWYDKEEFDEETARAAKAKDVTPTPTIAERLKGPKGRGFDKDKVDKEIENSAAGGASPADGKAGEGGILPSKEVSEKSGTPAPADPLEELLDTKVEAEPDPRAAAFDAGAAARDAGKPLKSVPEQFKKDMALSDAYQDGWRDRDKQLAEKAA